MSVATISAFIALGASIILVMRLPSRLAPVVALVASLIQVLLALRILSLSIKGLPPLALVLGAALCAAGVIGYTKASTKHVVAAAAALALLGGLQVLAAL